MVVVVAAPAAPAAAVVVVVAAPAAPAAAVVVVVINANAPVSIDEKPSESHDARCY